MLDPEKVVPTTLELGGDYDMLVITGPNTGGKTLTMKNVGIMVLMGQSGLRIPAEEGSERCPGAGSIDNRYAAIFEKILEKSNKKRLDYRKTVVQPNPFDGWFLGKGYLAAGP